MEFLTTQQFLQEFLLWALTTLMLSALILIGLSAIKSSVVQTEDQMYDFDFICKVLLISLAVGSLFILFGYVVLKYF